ncbi:MULTISPECIES: hypothetical protein [Methylobacterium]|uniref:Resolvase/invertase-type recombinase catalytic domain-containing protein n=1 Tax=Methylobacterium longum TaxID=767694 RepID=A0ABT8AXF9_9HYPH|nr:MULTISPECIES: hypothetical protein [Methylobacterium]MCJ2103711.1 hypothetical protein [Methylobacterium sp. E-046]MDN3574302.1 hypothetical protein [Methylobacterium longum]
MIRFAVSYAMGTDEITTNHETTRAAMEEAREFIRKGYHDVSLTDLGTGMRSSAGDIKKSLDRVDEFYRDSW